MVVAASRDFNCETISLKRILQCESHERRKYLCTSGHSHHMLAPVKIVVAALRGRAFAVLLDGWPVISGSRRRADVQESATSVSR